MAEEGCVRHLRFAEPFRVVMNSRSSRGSNFQACHILTPNTCDSSLCDCRHSTERRLSLPPEASGL